MKKQNIYYRPDYPLTGVSEGNRRVGRLQFATRDESGQFAKQQPYMFAKTRMGNYVSVPFPNQQLKTKKGTFVGDMGRSFRILVMIGATICGFAIGFFATDLLFDVLISNAMFGIRVTTALTTYRPMITTMMGLSACLLVVGLLVCLFFESNEANENVYFGGN